MSYFRFFPDVQFIAGPARGTIYHLSRARTYHLTLSQTAVVNDLVSNQPVALVLSKHDPGGKAMLDRLVCMGFGTFYSTPVFSEPYFPKCKFTIRGLLEPPPAMRIAYLQLADDLGGAECDCIDVTDYHAWQGCNSCLRWRPGAKGHRLNLKDIEATIDGLVRYNVQCAVFSGGDAFADPDLLLGVASRFKEGHSGIVLKVNSSGRHLLDRTVRTIQEFGVIPIFSVFGANEDHYRQVTGDEMLYRRLREAINLCKDYRIKYEITMVVPASLRHAYQAIWRFASSLDGQALYYTEQIPKNGPPIRPQSQCPGDLRVRDVGAQEFFKRQTSSFCLNGNIAVAADGSILPCPFWPKALGNIHSEHNLLHVFRMGIINQYWEMNKDTVPGCSNCENRYACVDCGLLEWAARESLPEQRRFCGYHPELGEWSDGETVSS